MDKNIYVHLCSYFFTQKIQNLINVDTINTQVTSCVLQHSEASFLSNRCPMSRCPVSALNRYNDTEYINREMPAIDLNFEFEKDLFKLNSGWKDKWNDGILFSRMYWWDRMTQCNQYYLYQRPPTILTITNIFSWTLRMLSLSEHIQEQ